MNADISPGIKMSQDTFKSLDGLTLEKKVLESVGVIDSSQLNH